jgi:FkbM family methyltransferase
VIATSYSQLGQDLFIAKLFSHKKNRFFVEIGAGNGVSLSNTYLLEKKYNWKGLLCEANPQSHESIENNRKCILEKKIIYKTSGIFLKFRICKDAEMSGISEMLNTSLNPCHKIIEKEIEIETISLYEAFINANVPKTIDYISLDTEGSEFEILNSFPFEKYKIKTWSIEHNKELRTDGAEYFEKLKNLMESKNYFFIPNYFDSYFISKKYMKSII